MLATGASALGLLAIMLTLASIFGVINHVTLRLPNTIGVLLIALVVSLVLLAADQLIPGADLHAWMTSVMGSIDLPATLFNTMLSFLLFAGSLHVDLGQLWSSKLTVFALATLGTVLAVAFLAFAMWFIFPLCGQDVPLIWCMVLGTILAPTDPVAVVGMLQRIGLPPRLQALFAGESLFNDGVGVVLFGVTLGIATGDNAGGAASPGGTEIAVRFLFEAFGGGAVGLATGFAALMLMRRVSDTHLETTISLALATGTYSLANTLHMSGPIAVVVAGLCMGSSRAHQAMSEANRAMLMSFWSIIDEVLNALLFLLMGFAVVAIPFQIGNFAAAVCAVPLAVAVRFASVLISALALHVRGSNRIGTLMLLTWGGLRGGISVALALSLPHGAPRPALLAVCYVTVIFTIVVQGLTMERLVSRFYRSGLS